MGKKEKYVEYDGLFHNATDYAVYHMSMKEKLLGGIVGTLAGGTVVFVFFGSVILAVLSLPLCFVGGIIVYRNMLLNKRNTQLVVQFRDMLESVSASLGSGRNVKDAFNSSYTDLKAQYGDNAVIVKELRIIGAGITNNVGLELLLQDFAKRSHNENVQNFADVFSVANKRGGNIRQIIFETKNVINEKIMVEQDIQTLISGKKNELNIMMVLPLIVVNQTKSMQGGGADDVLFGYLIKVVAFLLFIVAYVVGRKMMKIEV